jgi:hypothetical protein
MPNSYQTVIGSKRQGDLNLKVISSKQKLKISMMNISPNRSKSIMDLKSMPILKVNWFKVMRS